MADEDGNYELVVDPGVVEFDFDYRGSTIAWRTELEPDTLVRVPDTKMRDDILVIYNHAAV